MPTKPQKREVRRRFYIIASLEEAVAGLSTAEIHAEISDVFPEVHRRTVIRDLNALEKSGHIERLGDSIRNTYWKLNRKNALYL